MEIITMHEIQLNLCSVWNIYNFNFNYDEKKFMKKKIMKKKLMKKK